MRPSDIDAIRNRAHGLRRDTFPPSHREAVLTTVLEDDIPGLAYEVEQLEAMKARLETMCDDWEANGYLPAAIVVRSQMLGIDYNPVVPISTRITVTDDMLVDHVDLMDVARSRLEEAQRKCCSDGCTESEASCIALHADDCGCALCQ